MNTLQFGDTELTGHGRHRLNNRFPYRSDKVIDKLKELDGDLFKDHDSGYYVLLTDIKNNNDPNPQASSFQEEQPLVVVFKLINDNDMRRARIITAYVPDQGREYITGREDRFTPLDMVDEDEPVVEDIEDDPGDGMYSYTCNYCDTNIGYDDDRDRLKQRYIKHVEKHDDGPHGSEHQRPAGFSEELQQFDEVMNKIEEEPPEFDLTKEQITEMALEKRDAIVHEVLTYHDDGDGLTIYEVGEELGSGAPENSRGGYYQILRDSLARLRDDHEVVESERDGNKFRYAATSDELDLDLSPEESGEPDGYACSECDKVFDSKKGRGVHYASAHEEDSGLNKMMRCTICGHEGPARGMGPHITQAHDVEGGKDENAVPLDEIDEEDLVEETEEEPEKEEEEDVDTVEDLVDDVQEDDVEQVEDDDEHLEMSWSTDGASIEIEASGEEGVDRALDRLERLSG